MTQQNLLAKVRTIQNHFWMIEKILEKIYSREMEAKVARVSLQDVVIDTMKLETTNTSKLSITKQTRGNILLKV
jgi:hypothetical protein